MYTDYFVYLRAEWTFTPTLISVNLEASLNSTMSGKEHSEGLTPPKLPSEVNSLLDISIDEKYAGITALFL